MARRGSSDARRLTLLGAGSLAVFAACTGGSSPGTKATSGAAGTTGGALPAAGRGAGGAAAASGAATGGSGNVAGTQASSAGTASGGVSAASGTGGALAGSSSGGAAGPGAAAGGGAGGAAGSASGAPSSGGASAGSGDVGAGGEAGGGPSAPSVVEELELGDVWSGHPVFFALVTRGTHQLAAFYDAQRNMSVASRTLDQKSFTVVDLPSVLGWDSHNYVAMALDADDQVHVSGNMHGVPLVYFRTSTAFDTSTFAKLAMVGQNESSVTYPIFFNGPSGDLVFEYRDGQSGDGNTIFDSYSAASKTWTRLLNSALLDGQGQRNAYPEGPVLGPDGYFHLVWVWRDTADAATNHDLSYARSQDLSHWQAGDGSAIPLPITLANGDIVDAVPVNGGMINNNTRVGFDLEARPVVTYHKFDGAGNTQLYAARLEQGAWVVHRMTDWTKRWDFGGGGTLVFQIEVDQGVRTLPDGRLVQDVYNANLGGNVTLVLDDATLHASETLTPALTPYPPELATPVEKTAGMHVRWAADSGAGPDPNVRYMLRWETLDANGDQARDPAPPPSKLTLYGLAQ